MSRVLRITITTKRLAARGASRSSNNEFRQPDPHFLYLIFCSFRLCTVYQTIAADCLLSHTWTQADEEGADEEEADEEEADEDEADEAEADEEDADGEEADEEGRVVGRRTRAWSPSSQEDPGLSIALFLPR